MTEREERRERERVRDRLKKREDFVRYFKKRLIYTILKR